MPNGSSEGVKVKRWKPVFSLDRTAEGVRGIKVKHFAPSPSRPSFRIPAFLLGNLIVFGSRPPGQPAVTQTALLVHRVRGGLRGWPKVLKTYPASPLSQRTASG